MAVITGNTPLEPEERAQLKPAHVVTREQLNEWEQANIRRAYDWAFGRRGRRPELLSDDYVRLLHRKMFDATWEWAGRYRTTERNIGIDPSRISEAVRNLCDDTRYQIEHGVYPADEIGVRFHHRLVVVHPFPNGNGRHARLMTDILLSALGRTPFTWGSASLEHAGSARDRYLSALRAADGGEFEPLLTFVRS